MAAADAAPLFDGAFVAHAHVTAGIEHRVDGMLVAYCALGPGHVIGVVCVLPLACHRAELLRRRRRFDRLE